MTIVEQEEAMKSAIDQALRVVPFETLSVAYCVAVRDVLRPLLPNAQLEVYAPPRQLVVETREGRAIARVVLDLG